ncbi:hypothetical protein DYD21_08905 [Rhodohalobacter sp. SW132]|uniref:hypothetical protein n=1 Tax=Rhodohalobacter sp. SW132 TaxID=2293433 RepID=UPI000E278B57|nr:hypothetical protein [Rhodohalobacter sp. SW132]REL37888.1 hypothetical protein DYD21_08905 [Rhodohalobacter sp. SW132]
MKEQSNKHNWDEPLRKLLVDEIELDMNKLVCVLKCYIGIYSKDGLLILHSKFNELNARNKILTYLLGRKVSTMMKFEYPEIVDILEIKKTTGILRGVLMPICVELKTENLISGSGTSGYYVSESQMLHVLKELEYTCHS